MPAGRCASGSTRAGCEEREEPPRLGRSVSVRLGITLRRDSPGSERTLRHSVGKVPTPIYSGPGPEPSMVPSYQSRTFHDTYVYFAGLCEGGSGIAAPSLRGSEAP